MGFTGRTLAPLTFLLAITIPTLANWSSEEPQTRKHVVRANETLELIAGSYGFEVNELADYNQLDLTQILRPGQVIYFPSEIALQNPDPIPYDQVKPLDAEKYPNAVVESKPIQVTTTAKLGASTRLSGKEMDISISNSEPENPFQSDLDYNFTQKTNNDKKSNNGHSKYSSGVGSQSGSVQESGKIGFSVKTTKTTTKEPKEDEIGDNESPALSAFGLRPYAYFGNGDSLRDVLRNFAGSYYMPIVITDEVQGQVNGKIGPMTPVDFLDHLSNVFGFIWYFDGHSLFVYDGGAAIQKIISLNYMGIDQFKRTLKKIGIWDGRFFWKEQQGEGLVFISGPPRYIELVSETATLLDDKEGDRQKSKLTVKTFPLKYAWATDKSFTFRGQELTVPGVATLLQNIIHGGGVAQIEKKAVGSPTLPPAASVSRAGEEMMPAAAKGAGMQLNAGAVAEDIYINADPRLNAVIVHDLEAKMPMYEELIASLDKPSSQIEISVSIIDINTQDVRALGVEWNNTGSGSDTNVSFDAFPGDIESPSYTTILSRGLGSFNATLKLLADEGKAKVISRPSILTLDNLEAILDSSSTFYVKVESNEDSELFPVTSGTVVQVTPRIVKEDEGRRIHMSVNIQDGAQTSQEVSSLPTTTNSSINTQAIISEQESLLIGGFYKESDQELSSKVPLLGDIPILGHLFRSQSTTKNKQVRLFLITPRIIGITQT
ncbi:type III secretion system outer membrane ring subunit SctC [uncultured Endozoicomonas sp.]|uniref:type III secretion system outer membrane ring subunit SctC n=1 Tax=uncultured Endozoicomonas sp. TaxID=432652 RepID=UPI0026347CFF|nr:type III secretion system outer membrane ring subunit SctC [uncultured Endozoicomonas sp.]